MRARAVIAAIFVLLADAYRAQAQASRLVAAVPAGAGDTPSVSVADTSVVEGQSGPMNAAFPVTLTTSGAPSRAPVTVSATVELVTTSFDDFPPAPPPPAPPPVHSVTFPAGSTSGTTLPLLVPFTPDPFDEPDEVFRLSLEVAGGTLEPGIVTGRILDDDGFAAPAPTEIVHGTTLVADLVPPPGRSSDVDYYVMHHDPYSSWEVVIDAVSGDASPLQLQLLWTDGVIVDETAEPVGTGNALSLRWGHAYPGQHVRVRNAACGSACGTDDVYRLRAYETTLVAPRFNKNFGQSSVIVLQNRSSATVSGYAYFFQPGGTTDFAQGFQIAPRATAVLDGTSFLEGFSGSLVVTHDAPYGGLAGKVVSLEPATGFAFDTPLASKPALISPAARTRTRTAGP